MKLFKNYLSSIMLPGSVLRSSFAKFFCILSVLLFSSSSLFSQSYPEVEARIFDLRYVPSFTMTSPAWTGAAIVFEVQVRAGSGYMSQGWPLIASDLAIELNLESGVVLDFGNLKTINPVPNTISVTAIGLAKYPYPHYPPYFNVENGFLLHWERYYPLNNINYLPLTDKWAKVATCVVPVLSGTPTAATTLSFVASTGLPNGSTWGTGTSAGQGLHLPYSFDCPLAYPIGVNQHAIFENIPLSFCLGDSDYTLPLISDNGVTGTWDKPVIQPTTVGKDTFTFVGTGVCKEVVIVTINPLYEITVNNLADICGGTPYDLIDAVTLATGELADDYKFYTSDDGGVTYNPVSPATDLVQWVSGTYTYYARYENADLCPSSYKPFTVTVVAPATAIANVTCVHGEITQVVVTGPTGAPGDFEYALSDLVYQSGTTFGPFTPALTSPQSVYVKDLNTGCVSMVEISCPPCPDIPEITITNPGSGKICIGSGNYSVTGSFANADSVVVSHNGAGDLVTRVFYDSSLPFTAVYIPAAADIGFTVTLTFTIPLTATCSEVSENVAFAVNGLPNATFTRSLDWFDCNNSSLDLILRAHPTCGICSFSWSGGTPPLNEDSVIIKFGQVINPAGTTFTLTLTDGNGCVRTFDQVVFKDLTPVPPPVLKHTKQTFCDAATIEDLDANGYNVLWYAAPVGGLPLPSGTVLEHDGIYYAAQEPGANGCECEVRSAVKVAIVPSDELPAPDIKDQILCTSALASDIITDGSPGIVIFAPNGTELIPGMVLATFGASGGTYSAIYRYGTGGVNPPCESTDITYFTITLNTDPAIPPVIASPQYFCDEAVIANITVPGTGIVWYIDNTSVLELGQDIPLWDHVFYAAQSKGTGCAESTRVPVEIIIGTIPPPVVSSPYDLCIPATLGDINVSGFGITWHATSPGPALPFTTPIPEGTHTFYVSQNGSTTCGSSLVPVVVNVTNCGNLLDCDAMDDKIVEEDYFKACKYTHAGTGWDAENFTLIAHPFDDIEYYINGILSPSGATLNGAEFPVGVSTVEVIAYSGAFSDTCYFDVTVERACPSVSDPDGDGNTYTVSKVAGLCWTANLKTTTYMNSTPIEFAEPYFSTIYPDIASNTNTFGLLYTWYSAVGVDEGSSMLPVPNASGYIQGICPAGWHVPTQAEQAALNIWSAKDLKSTHHWLVPGTNLSTYDSRGAGKYNASIDRYIDLLGFTGYWASNAGADANAPYISITYYMDDCDPEANTTSKLDGLSVRCVWDGEACP